MSAGKGVLAVMDRDSLHADAYRIAFGVIDSTPQALAKESDEARATVERMAEALALRVDWCNGSWYVLSFDGAALSNQAHATEAGARGELETERAAALAAFRGE